MYQHPLPPALAEVPLLAGAVPEATQPALLALRALATRRRPRAAGRRALKHVPSTEPFGRLPRPE